MGGFRPAELVLLVAVVFFLGYGLALPIVGIVLAAGKKRRRARATGAVIWSSINLALFCLGAVAGIVAHIPPIGPVIGLALNGVWLSLALQANRAANTNRPEIP
jgi:multisubunit Na+/H+ antiporter MnhC subunit